MDAKGGLADKNEDNDTPLMDTALDRQVPTPEVNVNYMKSSVMLSRGNIYTRGKVIGRKIDTSLNAVGRRNFNPILEMRRYRF